MLYHDVQYRHTAARLAAEGATVIVHGRRESTVREAIDFVKGQGNGEAKVEGIVADVSSLRGMNQLCDDVLARTDRLDCLVNNAGGPAHEAAVGGVKWRTFCLNTTRGRVERFLVGGYAFVVTSILLEHKTG